MADKMAFGKFIPAESKIITNIYGEKVPLNKPAGYAGLFWGTVFDENGGKIDVASDYFRELASDLGEDDDFCYWEIIDHAIEQYCKKHLRPISDKSERHHYQYGFGGDNCDGLIDFWLPESVPEMPDLEFTIDNKKYTIRWEYSPGDDDD